MCNTWHCEDNSSDAGGVTAVRCGPQPRFAMHSHTHEVSIPRPVAWNSQVCVSPQVQENQSQYPWKLQFWEAEELVQQSWPSLRRAAPAKN